MQTNVINLIDAKGLKKSLILIMGPDFFCILIAIFSCAAAAKVNIKILILYFIRTLVR